MKKTRIISALTSAAILMSSCSVGFPRPEPGDLMLGMEAAMLSGTITDTEGNPIEHLKVTLEWNGGSYQDIKYTSSIGQFEAGVKDNPESEVITLEIIIEDIDNEENGGLFETYTETVSFIKNDITEPVLTLNYRLNHATASESSPQS